MESDQVHVLAPAVPCNSQQVVHAVETRIAGKSERDVAEGDGLDRLHDDVPPVHRVATPHLHMGTRPDPNAASDLSSSYSLAKPLGEEHFLLPSDRAERRAAAARRTPYPIRTSREARPSRRPCRRKTTVVHPPLRSPDWSPGEEDLPPADVLVGPVTTGFSSCRTRLQLTRPQG